MSKKDYYEILGISRSATEVEIKRAYRTLAVQHHPDKNPNDPHAEERFKECAEAYAVLSDSQKRAQYDRFGHAGMGGGGFDPGFTNIEDIFDLFGFGDMFGSRGRTRTTVQRGSDLRYDLEITLEDAANGKDERLRIPRLEKCGECDGLGAEKGTHPENCIACGGRGQTQYQQGFRHLMNVFGMIKTVLRCFDCGLDPVYIWIRTQVSYSRAIVREARIRRRS